MIRNSKVKTDPIHLNNLIINMNPIKHHKTIHLKMILSINNKISNNKNNLINKI